MGELFMFAIVEMLVELVAQGQGKADNFVGHNNQTSTTELGMLRNITLYNTGILRERMVT